MQDLAILIGVEVVIQIDRLMADGARETFLRTTELIKHKALIFRARTMSAMCDSALRSVKEGINVIHGWRQHLNVTNSCRESPV